MGSENAHSGLYLPQIEMKILCFNWRDITHPMAGGAEVCLHEIAKRLADRHQVVLFCGKYNGCTARDEIDGIRIIRQGGNFSVYLHAIFSYLTDLRRENHDVIVDSINGVPFFTPLFVRKPKIAIIFDSFFNYKFLGTFYHKQLKILKDMLGQIPLVGGVTFYNMGTLKSSKIGLGHFMCEHSYSFTLWGES